MKCLKTLSAVLATGLLFVPSAHAVTVYYQPTPLPSSIPESNFHIRDGWVNNYYPAIKTFQEGPTFKMGGHGDSYLSLLQFDDAGLPKEVLNAYLFLWNLPRNGANPSQVALYRATTKWDTSVTWGNPRTSGVFEPYALPLPNVNARYTYSPSPTVENSFYGMWITEFYNSWRSGASPNHGLVIYPNDGNNYQFNYFASSNNANDGIRPILRLDFTPSLELKLPFDGTGGKKWRVTTEIGGITCSGMHGGHQGRGYFSIDFSGRAKMSDGKVPDTFPAEGVPILAAAKGTVVSVTSTIIINGNPLDGYGNSVLIEHENPVTGLPMGIATRYSHMKPYSVNPILAIGTKVPQGKFLGKMGDTGWSEGAHLDFNIAFKNANGVWVSDVNQGALARVVMEGQILKSYQVDKCESTGINEHKQRFYPSSNVMIP